MTDREIIMQMLNREIDNIIARINNPVLSVFSEPVKRYAESILSPYIDAFTDKKTGDVNSDMASEFVKEELNSKVEDFKKRFESRKDI